MSFVRFAQTDIVNDTAKITTSTWTNNTNELTAVHTSSTQAALGSPTSSGAHFIEVYNADPDTDSTAEVQYAVAYGHVAGSGRVAGRSFSDPAQPPVPWCYARHSELGLSLIHI